MLYPVLWAYQMFVKASTGFTHFQLVYGLESTFPMECKMPSLKLAVQLLVDTSSLETFLVHLGHLDEKHWDATIMNEAHKRE